MSKDEKPAITSEASAILEGFKSIAEELKQSRIEAPDLHARAMKRATRRSNDVGPEISAFNLRGQKDYPMPALKCEIRAPYSIHPAYHGLDREEVELFNKLEPGEYDIELNDGSPGRLIVKGVFNEVTEKLERMEIKAVPEWTNERKGLFPSMRVMLRAMLGEAAGDVLTMAQERRKIEAGELAISLGE